MGTRVAQGCESSGEANINGEALWLHQIATREQSAGYCSGKGTQQEANGLVELKRWRMEFRGKKGARIYGKKAIEEICTDSALKTCKKIA